MEYFSDKEKGKPFRTQEKITIPIWNGLVLVINEFIANMSLAASFPDKCYDSGEICGCSETAINDGIVSIIPNLGMDLYRLPERTLSPFDPISDDKEIDTYAVLDLIEYIYHNIKDANKIGSYHDFFKHYHYRFEDNGVNKNAFREKINELFERNGMIYTLTDEGEIQRIVPLPVNLIIHQVIKTHDEELDKLVAEAVGKIVLPKKEDRKLALEKLWDAFERSKTYFFEEGTIDKKMSISKVLDNLSNGKVEFRSLLDNECKTLTAIGNQFQIRHFEKNKVTVEDSNEIDYLFYRMYSYIYLFSECIS